MPTNSSYIFNEQASGLSNGSNKVFTTVNTISSIESLRIGYIEYTNFTYSGNTITLADAPSIINGGVYVDYFYESSLNVFDSVNLIYDEELSGVVDGVNKIFYSVYPIDKIDELRVGGVVYNGFSFNGRVVTLASAPTISLGAPHLDYYRKDVNVNTIDSGVTLAELRSSIYTRLGQTITSLQFPKELADEYISEGIVRISKMKPDRTKRGIFSFHKANDGQITSTDGNTIVVDKVSAYLPSKGVAIIDGGEVVYYNGKSRTNKSISSLSDLDLNNIAGLKIQYGYKLSKTISKVSEVFYDGFKLTPCDFSEYRFSKDKDKFCEYNGYLFLPYNVVDGAIITVVYIGRHNSEYSDTDIIDFDGDYLPVIKSFVLYNMYKDREDDRFANEIGNYKQLLREYKRELGKQYETTSAVFQTAGPLNKY